ncbi:MAG: hypothetical protein ABIH26_06575 [Candidatus Eisenbacteria bacterium]
MSRKALLLLAALAGLAGGLVPSCGGKQEVVETRYPDGQPRVRRAVRLDEDGRPINHGRYAAWHPNGRPEVEGKYREGKREGRFTYWHANGVKAREGVFREGKEEGLWVRWHENGNKADEGEYRGGKREGLWTNFDPGGSIASRRVYRAGVPESEQAAGAGGRTPETTRP